MSDRLAEEAGVWAVYMSGFSATASLLGRLDIGRRSASWDAGSAAA
jgi:hypothetical protein